MKEYPGLPETIKCGYKTFRIVIWHSVTGFAKNRYGECSPAEGEIRIIPGLDRFEAANTVIHELLHALSIVWAIPAGCDEETQVTHMANALCTVIRDNPALLIWAYNQLVPAEEL